LTFRVVASVDEVWSGEMHAVTVGGCRVLLVSVGAAVCAYEDRCAHQGMPLSAGRIEGAEIVCPLHEWRYDARTGRGVNPEAVRLRPFPLRVEEGRILVDVDAVEGWER
jgi:toluene monooxygenase system ferredoxin subunit